MEPEKGWDALLALGVKAGLSVVMLLGIGALVAGLPFARGLTVFGDRLGVSDFIGSLLALAVVAVIAGFSSSAAPHFDGLLPWLRGAGRLFKLLSALLVLLYSYYALQPSVYPFIGGFEWSYQSLFLGCTLFALARAGLLVHAAGDELGKRTVALLRRAGSAMAGGADGRGSGV